MDSFVAQKDERLLRLALAALGGKLCGPEATIEKELKCGMASASPSEGATASCVSETVSSIGEDSSVLEAEAELPAAPDQPDQAQSPHDVEEPRIGIDIGNVLLRILLRSRGRCGGRAWDELREVPGGVEAVRAIVERFEARNVFLVSKLRVGGEMHQAVVQWLHGPRGFLARAGIPADNVVFVSAASGPDGKGVAAARLGLSFFVDDSFEVLRSVFADAEGNSGTLVRRFSGVLFHFQGSAFNRGPSFDPSELRGYYCAVAGWSQVRERLFGGAAAGPGGERGEARPAGPAPPPSAAGGGRNVASSEAAVATARPSQSRIPVGIEQDAAFGVVERLLGASAENFKFITAETGAKVILNGRGSPHPQARSLEQEPLTICIRAKTCESHDEAASLVRDLLSGVRQEYRELVGGRR